MPTPAKCYWKFVKARLFKKSESTYLPATWQNIGTGIKIKKPLRAISDLQKGIQSFGLLVEKTFQYPIATFSLSLLILTAH